MLNLRQSPTDPDFVQNPYPFYENARENGPLHYWEDYGMPAAFDLATVNTVFRDRRFGREVPKELAPEIPAHLEPFYAVEAHSMLELEPPRHTRLRSLVLRAFTSRRIKELAPEIEQLSHDLIDRFPETEFDLLPYFAQHLPVIIIARLLGVPDTLAPQLLDWSNAMVGMYQARKDRSMEDAAANAAREFSDFLRGYIETRRASPSDDLISHLIAAEQDGEKLSYDELITTCILLLNAGHEATVHSLGNGIKALLGSDHRPTATNAAALVEEILRYDPALHMFTRYAYEPVMLYGHQFQPGDQVALLLGAANRDPDAWSNPNAFDPDRQSRAHTSFGGGIHFCVGAPLARLEMQIALPILFDRCPDLSLAKPATYANVYHFHGLKDLTVTR